MKRSAADQSALSSLFASYGHTFSSVDLLDEALTHPSAQSGRRRQDNTYQRLEFLGDRVLALIIAETLLERHPREPEGTLSRRLTQLVRAETCAEVARDMGLAPFIRLGIGEAQSGGRMKSAILADVAESVVGAVFRDGGYAAAKSFVLKAWAGPLAAMDETSDDLRDAKTRLQEAVQSLGYPPPVYTLVSRQGPDHNPEFVISVDLGRLGRAQAAGSTKRNAEQAAAAAMLASLDTATLKRAKS